MQSGIAASPDLYTAFQYLVSSTSQRGLLATIAKEEIIPGAILASRSTDFFQDLETLAKHLSDNEATYIILRRYSELNNGFIAITYIPNSAPVRQKMLFASTRLTLVRELGIERFKETMFVTEKAELTAEGFIKHDQHSELAAPLTEEEQSLGAVKRAEAEEGRGMSMKKSHTSVGMSMPVSEDASAALKKLADAYGSENFVQLKLDLPVEIVSLACSRSCDASNLSAAISSTEPRYSFFKYTNGETVLIFFIYSCPSASKVKERMVYASTRNHVLNIAEKAGITVDKKIEVSDPNEITQTTIEEEFRPRSVVKVPFERPKRPGRR